MVGPIILVIAVSAYALGYGHGKLNGRKEPEGGRADASLANQHTMRPLTPEDIATGSGFVNPNYQTGRNPPKPHGIGRPPGVPVPRK